MIKEVQEFYKDTYNKLKTKDEPQRDTLKAIHYAVGGARGPPASAHLQVVSPAACLVCQPAHLSLLAPFLLVSLIPIPAFCLQLDCCGLAGGVEQFISDICPKKDILESIQVKVK